MQRLFQDRFDRKIGITIGVVFFLFLIWRGLKFSERSAKSILIIFLLIYVVFAAVVIRQARMMTDTLEVGFETQIKFLVLIHFALAVLALVLSFIIL